MQLEYLIIVVKLLVVFLCHKFPDEVAVETDPIIKISKPNDGFMVLNCSVFLEPESVIYSLIVSVSLVVVCKSSGKMSRDETYPRVGVLKAYCTATFITGHSGEARLHDHCQK